MSIMRYTQLTQTQQAVAEKTLHLLLIWNYSISTLTTIFYIVQS